MKKSIELLCTNVLLKTGSLIGACIFWYFFSGVQLSTLSVAVPLCFYNTHATQHIDAPQEITVVLQGQRTHLRSITQDALAIHIDADTLPTGAHPVALTSAQLFLPESIKLVHYFPTPIHITVKTDCENIL